MVQCEICKKRFKAVHALSCHISKFHTISIQEYYDRYLYKDIFEGTCKQCNFNFTKFYSLSKGYGKWCSTSCMNKSFEHKKLVQNGVFKKYGVDCVFQSEVIKEKIKDHYKEKYGVEHNSQLEDWNKKKCQTMKKRYGAKHALQIQVFKDKAVETTQNKYGVDYAMQHPDVVQKSKEGFQKKYGTDNIFNHPKFVEMNVKRVMDNFYDRMLTSTRFKKICTPNFSRDEYFGTNHLSYSWICSKCGYIFNYRISDGRLPRCPKCFPRTIIKSPIYEKEISDFCKQYFPNLIENDRDVLNGKEIDILIPEINLGIEFNGLYWHSEQAGRGKYYHLEKTKTAWEKGINLIHIFEDEWIEKQDIIQSMLLLRLGEAITRIYGRKCTIQPVNNKTGKKFLYDNHLQSEINGTHLGLFYENELVCLLTIGVPRFNKNYEWEILRFCNKSNVQVIGGLSKLVNYFKSTYNPKSIVTYSDLRYGRGEGYKHCGFKLENLSAPNYFYINGSHRESRLKYQKHKLKDKLELYDPNLTEWENMQMNGYDRIWDCGNHVYIWNQKVQLCL